MNFDFLSKYLPYFNDGMIVTILISAFVVLIGTLLGIVTALAKISKIAPLRWLANIYIEIFRGTPMLVQIMLCFGLMGSLSYQPFKLGFYNKIWGA